MTSIKLEAIVLAGGFGTRLRQLVSDVPKPMAPIAGRPFLEILLEFLAKNKFERVIISLGFMAEKIINHFHDNFAGIEIVYVVEETPLGTGGAIRLAMSQCHQDHLFIFNGDTFLDLQIDLVEQHWRIYRNPIIVGREVPDTTRYGRLIINEKKQLLGFSKEQVSGVGYINAGCYVFNQGQLDAFPLHQQFSLEADYLPNAVQHSNFDMFVTAGKFIDIGVPEDYLRAQTELVNYL